MGNETALQDARGQLRELIEAARKGAIIPVRLTGQLEAIEALLAQHEESAGKAQAEAAAPAASAPAADTQESMADNARFVSHAVHELRTPMTSIRGYSDMLGNPAMGPLNDMQKQFVETIRTNARRMEGLLTDVSDMAKIRGGTLRIQTKMDTFKNIGLMIEKKTQPQAESMSKKLTFEIPDGLPLLEVDGEMLAKAIGKLIENALRYSPAEGAEVTLRAEKQDGKLRLRVQDNGIGMTPEELAQLGTIYFRADRDEVRAHKGSGLGIPVAYGIIRLLGGTIEVESKQGEGTTFTVLLSGIG